MNVPRTALWAGLLALGQGLCAQEPQEQERVVLTVTAVSGRSVFLDRGREAGLEPGMRVRLFAPGGPLQARIEAVAGDSARADLPPGALPPVGTRGEVFVPVRETGQQPPPRPAGAPAPPAHPPWTREEGERPEDLPLLAPAFARAPDERPVQLRGRTWLNAWWSEDRGGDRRSRWLSSRLGARADATNLFGHGGRLHVAGEWQVRATDVQDRDDRQEQRLRLDRLSYAVGGEDWAASRLEVGRFVSPLLPEIGLLDGAEGVLQFEGGTFAGAGFGALPLPFPARDSGDDLGLHVFGGWQDDGGQEFVVAYQKTWHRGHADRDLLLLRARLRPTEALWLFGSAKVDLYTASDPVHGSELDLTELWLQARYAPGADGIAVSVSRFRWAETERREFATPPGDLLFERVDRLDVDLFGEPLDGLRVALRGDLWRDRERDGAAGSVDLQLRDLAGTGTWAGLTVFRTDGSFQQGEGARLELRRRFGAVDASAGYEWQRYRTSGLLFGDERLQRQAVRLGADFDIGEMTSVGLGLDRQSGDGEDSITASLFLQYLW